MAKRQKIKPLFLFEKGRVYDYQAIIEEIIGTWLAKGLDFYDANMDGKTNIKGRRTDSDRAYFVPEDDYEIVVRKKRKKSKD